MKRSALALSLSLSLFLLFSLSLSAPILRENVGEDNDNLLSKSLSEIHQKTVEIINGNPNGMWKAKVYEKWANWTMKDARRLNGLRGLSLPSDFPDFPRRSLSPSLSLSLSLPTSFDAREKWPAYIHPIRNQMQCGSCYSFSGSEVLGDRFAIATNGTVGAVLSAQDMVSCDPLALGCDGSLIPLVWMYLRSTGIVTDKCMPYTAGGGDREKCPDPRRCEDASEPWIKYRASSMHWLLGEKMIQHSLMTEGPVQAGMLVYSDFLTYTSGIYCPGSSTCTSDYTNPGNNYSPKGWPEGVFGKIEGGHAVKIVGWGEEKGVKYWTVANSWGSDWGIDGYFKIVRGRNAAFIESQVFAGLPLVE